MVKHINPSRMRFRLEFGDRQDTDKTNPNTGEALKDFKSSFSLWAGLWSLTQNQILSLAGANINNAEVFFIRHNADVANIPYLRFNGMIYKIDNIAFDDGIGSSGFDLITCHREVVKHG